jgi:hypothetical protein
MSLAPSASVTLGNQRFDSHAHHVEAQLGWLPAVGSFRVVLPAKQAISASPGDRASLSLDGGDGAETVLTGKIRHIKRRFAGTEVLVADAAADLGAYRPAETYERQDAAAVVRALASAVAVDVGDVGIDLPLALYVAHPRRTAAEHVAQLASLGGAAAIVDGAGKLQVATFSSHPDLALKRGRELLEIECRALDAPPARRVAIGGGPAGTVEAPEALLHTIAPLPEDADAPGASTQWSASLLLRTPPAVRAAGQAMAAEDQAATERVRAVAFLLPKLRPGMVVQLQELPSGFTPDTVRIERVTHVLDPAAGALTIFTGRSAAAAAGAGLAAAVGGLL